jgi:hypothetical protein
MDGDDLLVSVSDYFKSGLFLFSRSLPSTCVFFSLSRSSLFSFVVSFQMIWATDKRYNTLTEIG